MKSSFDETKLSGEIIDKLKGTRPQNGIESKCAGSDLYDRLDLIYYLHDDQQFLQNQKLLNVWPYLQNIDIQAQPLGRKKTDNKDEDNKKGFTIIF